MPVCAWASPTYEGAGEGTAGLMWASSPPAFHTARLQVEHMLRERKGREREGCHLGKQHQPHPPRAVTITCFWGVGDGYKVPSIQGCADGVSSLAQRCLSGPRNLCPDPGSMGRVRAAWRKYGLFSVPCGTHPRLTSPRRPTMMRAQTGWKAPVPHASRWVRLWGCSTRTKLAHSI